MFRKKLMTPIIGLILVGALAALLLTACESGGKDPATLASIAVTTNPTKTAYTAGDSLDLAGLVVTATYSDSSTKAVTDYTTDPVEGATLNDTAVNSVTVSYTEDGVTKDTSFTITVSAGSTPCECTGEGDCECTDCDCPECEPVTDPVTVEELEALIEDAEALKATVDNIDTDGSNTKTDELWVTEEMMEALNAAILAAEEAIDNDGDLDAAYAALETAMENFVPTAGTSSKENPDITTWPTASAITYGAKLETATLTGGSANVAGSFDWTNGDLIPTVSNEGYEVIFTPDDTTTYNTRTETVAITVTPKALTWNTNGTVNSKTYDGTTTATVATQPTLNGVIAGDTVTVTNGTVTFNNATAGSDKAITATGFGIGGTSAGNYTISGQPPFANAIINAKTLNWNDDGTVASRQYDGTTNATVATQPTLNGVISGDTVTVTNGTIAFTSAVEGTTSFSVLGYNIGGADVGNYQISGQPTFTGKIYEAADIFTFSNNNTIDGLTEIGQTFASIYINEKNGTNDITSIDDSAFFQKGYTFTTVTFATNSKVSSILDGAFAGCSSLTEITIPSSVTSIGIAAFANCSSLTSINIPSGVPSIGSTAFQGTNLRTVIFEGANTTFGSNNLTFLYGASLYAAYITNEGGAGTYVLNGTTWEKQ